MSSTMGAGLSSSFDIWTMAGGKSLTDGLRSSAETIRAGIEAPTSVVRSTLNMSHLNHYWIIMVLTVSFSALTFQRSPCRHR